MNTTLELKMGELADLLRNGTGLDQLDLVEQVALLLYLKLLDQEEQQNASDGSPSRLFPNQAARYRWSQWVTTMPEDMHRFVSSDVLPYMGSLSREAPPVAAFFRDSRLLIDDPAVFARVVSLLEDIDLRTPILDDTKNMLEHLLDRAQGDRRLGEFRTPPSLRQLMVRLLDPTPDDTICDFACGTGGFLIDAVDYMQSSQPSSSHKPGTQEAGVTEPGWADPTDMAASSAAFDNSIFGFDLSHRMTRIAIVNLMLHGVHNPRIMWGNSLDELSSTTHRYSALLSNPPMGLQVRGNTARLERNVKTSDGDLLFLTLMLDALAPAGRCAVVVPSGLLFRKGEAYIQLRRRLVEKQQVLAVIRLPSGTLPHVGVAANILVFQRPADGMESDEQRAVWFYEVPSPESFNWSNRLGGLAESTSKALLAAWADYRASGFREPPGHETETVLEERSASPTYWWASVQTIAKQSSNPDPADPKPLYSLNPADYKPRVAPPQYRDDPVDLVRHLLTIEASIESDLQTLLHDLQSSA